MHPLRITLALLMLAMIAAPCRAAAPDEDDPAQRLGDPFDSLAAGIRFRPPAGGVMSRRATVGRDIVQYANVAEKWSLKVSQIYFDRPTRLMAADGAKAEPGLLDETASQLRLQHGGTQVLRKDVVNIGRHDAGILISRFAQAGVSWLRQQAFVQADDRKQRFYVFDLTTPSGHAADDPEGAEDPSEAMAAGVFRAMLDTIEVLDQTPLMLDNENRTYRASVLLVNLPKRIRTAVAPEQYFRVVREGRDIGWVYQTEEIARFGGNDGVLVAVRSHGASDADNLIDVASEMFAAMEAKRPSESWMTVNRIINKDKERMVTEVGQALRKMRPIFEGRDPAPLGPARAPAAPAQPPAGEGEQVFRGMTEVYTLNVTQVAESAKPVTRPLPDFYVPQAIAQMLPRLVPVTEAKGYLFGVWVPAEQELVYRYIDVESPRDVTFNGRTVRAIPVKDRVGLEGEPTWHYIAAADARYIGSITPSTGVSLVATDVQTLSRLWPDAKFERPKLLEAPAEDGPAAPRPERREDAPVTPRPERREDAPVTPRP